MHRRRIYADTSAIGGCLDAEFASGSVPLFDVFAAGEAILVLSDLTLLELASAPEPVRRIPEGVPAAWKELVEFNEEAALLAERYIGEGVIGAGMRMDARHMPRPRSHASTCW